MILSKYVVKMINGISEIFPDKGGYVLVALSQIFISIQMISIKLIFNCKSYDIALYRGYLLIFWNWPAVKSEQRSIVQPRDSKTNKILFLRSFIAAAQVLVWFQALRMIDLGDALVLGNTTPLWSILTFTVFLKQKISRRTIGLIFASFLGVLITVQSRYQDKQEVKTDLLQYLIGACLSLLSAILFAFVSYQNQNLKDSVTVPIILHYFYLGTIIVVSLFNILIGSHQNYSDLLQKQNLWVIIFASIFAYTGQNCMNKALCITKSYKVLPFMYLSIVFGFIADWLLFNVEISIQTILGSIIIVVSCFLLQQKKD